MISDKDFEIAAADVATALEIIFTCPKCEANYTVQHLPQPVTECPVCGQLDWKREDELTARWLEDGQ